jgi:hypothetical protein
VNIVSDESVSPGAPNPKGFGRSGRLELPTKIKLASLLRMSSE